MHISVIIPVYNDTDRLKLCLDALSKQTVPRDEFEVIVIDNGSEEPPRELVESYPFCRFAEESKQGSYAARNKGLELAEGEILAFTDADCIPKPHWLEEGIKVVSVEGFNGQVGGLIKVFPLVEDCPTGVELYDMIYGLRQDVNVQCRFAATANMITKREVFDAIGYFDDQLMSGGDTDWGQRVASAGRSIVYSENVIVSHPARDSLEGIIRQAKRHAGGRHDKFVQKSSQMSWLRILRAGLRLATPPVADCYHGFRESFSRGYGVIQGGKVSWVIMAVYFSRLTTIVGSFFTTTRERQ